MLFRRSKNKMDIVKNKITD